MVSQIVQNAKVAKAKTYFVYKLTNDIFFLFDRSTEEIDIIRKYPKSRLATKDPYSPQSDPNNQNHILQENCQGETSFYCHILRPSIIFVLIKPFVK